MCSTVVSDSDSLSILTMFNFVVCSGGFKIEIYYNDR